MTMTWNESLQSRLSTEFDCNQTVALINRYSAHFPTSYQERCSVDEAIVDVKHMNALNQKQPFRVAFYRSHQNNNHLRLKLFQFNNPIALSDVLPMLENLGLRTLNEYPYELIIEENQKYYISDFTVVNPREEFDINSVNMQLQDAFIRILSGDCENDGFNKLVLEANLSWREVMVLRAYSKYMQQIRFRFSQTYIENTLAKHPKIANALIKYFNLKFDPFRHDQCDDLKQLEKSIRTQLEAVTSLDEDRIITRYFELIEATLRTNYFQISAEGSSKSYLSFKINSAQVPDLPSPKPLYEIFVYSPRVEGIHLRGAKVARGGIRWSDRREDFRTEVLGLMKAQKVKNAVIVPSGAKGGFVLKKLPVNATRGQVQLEVVTCYQLFIRGLLDITDNIVKNEATHPATTVCYDDFDTYLVVAADKGTASFSDTANAISKEYQFWLGDAFASGGSAGYDHKKMGITARGAWESIKRHFREVDVNVETTDISVVGVGDMSGDVFGNGMLYTNHIKLIAAFDHRHIFIDPSPDPEKAYIERERLFNLASSSWEDYNTSLISSGGGVYSRSAKSIQLTPQVKLALSINDDQLTPNELIRAILRAPVDLLFNGGIGTYVKSTNENNADVGDKANEFCRINGAEIRAKVVGEGGNLGFTQLGRVEYAINGGLINTDFIDNSAGVDCSDHEVNIKILLNKKVLKGEMSLDQRNELLAAMTKEVGQLVLRDNYQQALVMSFSSINSAKYTDLYLNNIRKLESVANLDRVVEYLPSDKQLLERKANGGGLTRPELAVLLAYTKIHLKNEILKSALPEDEYFSEMITSAFPSMLNQQYPEDIKNHTLKREIIATQISNHVVNSMGITFAYRLQTETGASIAEIAKAYMVSRIIFDADSIQQHIASLDFKVTAKLQYELLHHVRYLLNLATRWFLHHDRMKGDINSIINYYRVCINQLAYIIPDLIVGSTKQYLRSLNEQFVKSGLSADTARRVVISRVMYAGLNISEIASQHNLDLLNTAKVYFDIGGKFGLVIFRDQLANDNREGDLSSLARLALRDDLDTVQRQLTVVIMKSNPKEEHPEQLIQQWLTTHQSVLKRWEEMVELLRVRTELDYTMFFIALRELSTLISGAERHMSHEDSSGVLCDSCKMVLSSQPETV